MMGSFALGRKYCPTTHGLHASHSSFAVGSSTLRMILPASQLVLRGQHLADPFTSAYVVASQARHLGDLEMLLKVPFSHRVQALTPLLLP